QYGLAYPVYLVVDFRKRIQYIFLTFIPMLFPLFSESIGVEIQKVSSNQLVGIGSCEVLMLIVFSIPGFADIDRSVFAWNRHLYVVDRDLTHKSLLQVGSCQRIGITQNHDARLCARRQRMAVQEQRIELGHWDNARTGKQQRLFDSVSAL